MLLCFFNLSGELNRQVTLIHHLRGHINTRRKRNIKDQIIPIQTVSLDITVVTRNPREDTAAAVTLRVKDDIEDDNKAIVRDTRSTVATDMIVIMMIRDIGNTAATNIKNTRNIKNIEYDYHKFYCFCFGNS